MYRIPQCIELHTQITALHCIIFFDAFSFPFFLIRKIFSVMKNGMDYKLKFFYVFKRCWCRHCTSLFSVW